MAANNKENASVADTSSQEALQQLQNDEQRELLDTIKTLKGLKLRDIDLPQLVVVGDQSSGKSSVLDAISRIRFPSKPGTCTTFATELIMRTEPAWRGSVSIVPGEQSTPEVAEAMKKFRASCSSPEQVPECIEKAKQYIKEKRTPEMSIFSDHTLHVEISGPDTPPLDLVDLPGLIQSTDNIESNDKEIVNSLVKKYVSNPQAIIMTIVSAAYERYCQAALEIAERADPECRRTFGVITKPDATNDEACKDTYISFAKGTNPRYKQEWHVLKNRGSGQEKLSAAERDKEEDRFFSHGDWAAIPKEHVGAAALRSRLSYKLYQKILQAHDGVKNDVRTLRDAKQAEKDNLGPPRPEDPKEFLIGLSFKFSRLIERLIDGSCKLDKYPVSLEEVDPRQISAIVRKLNNEFSRRMHEHGHRWEICDSRPATAGPRSGDDATPQPIFTEEFLELVRKFIDVSHANEPSGTINPAVIQGLFRHQSQPWRRLAKEHLELVFETIEDWIRLLAKDVTGADAELNNALCDYLLNEKLRRRKPAMWKTFELVIAPFEKAHMVTYSPFFDVIVATKQGERRSRVMSAAFEKNKERIAAAENAAQLSSLGWMKEEYDVELTTRIDIIDCMLEYYKHVILQFVDNVAFLVINETLLNDLPEIFTPETVYPMDPETVASIVSEAESTVKKRAELEAEIKDLDAALELFKPWKHRPVSGEYRELLDSDADELKYLFSPNPPRRAIAE
ncbi:hypothetical protein NA57DRAFT_78531 [Rhizodiscina lignyota]|uniref:Dynamin family protein n=1 Tax=Rhizodiscina lignyota TaxID=1504668 RepID=A0A9P4M735_9PEZI|nr:hypothetical protein NA57DRAFT_78531 [Rhizodiscina lignyota]